MLRQLDVQSGEKLLLFGGGSVGIIATQLAVARGVTVISAVGEAHRQLESGNVHERIILTLN